MVCAFIWWLRGPNSFLPEFWRSGDFHNLEEVSKGDADFQSKFNLAEGSLVSHHSLSLCMDSYLRAHLTYRWSTFQATGKGALVNLHALRTFLIGTESVPCSAHGVRKVGQRTEHFLLREKPTFAIKLKAAPGWKHTDAPSPMLSMS